MGKRQIDGVITRIIYRSDDGYTVAEVEDEKGLCHKAVGKIFGGENEMVTLTGDWSAHPKFGPQLKVTECIQHGIQNSFHGIVGFLDRLPNIGPVRARAIFKKFENDTFKIIEESPEKLSSVPGVTLQMCKDIQNAFLGTKQDRSLVVYLKNFRLTDGQVAKIMNRYKDKARIILKLDPYRMISEIDGFGFKIVDQIALKAGTDRTSSERIKAGLLFVLEENSNDGHTFMPKGDLIAKALNLLMVPQGKVVQCLNELIKDDEIVLNGDAQVYSRKLFEAECQIAARLLEIAYTPEQPTVQSSPEGGEWL